MLESNPQSILGRNAGELKDAILLNLYVDKGGSSVKSNLIINGREEDCHDFTFPVARFEGKDSYYYLYHTFLKLFDQEIERLSDFNILFVAEESHFVVTYVPSDCVRIDQLDWIADEDETKMFGVRYRDNDYYFINDMTITWRSEDWKAYKILKLEFFLGGDLVFLATAQGREDHAGSKCLWCLAYNADFHSHAYTGDPVTTDRLLSLPSERIKRDRFGCCVESPPIIQSIPVNRFIPPPLHLKLGIVNNIIDHMRLSTGNIVIPKSNSELTIYIANHISKETFDSFLSNNGIDTQAYHGGSLIGRHASLVLERHAEIVSDFSNYIADIDLSDEEKDFYEGYFDDLCETLSSFELLFYLITSTLQDNYLKKFKILKSIACTKYRALMKQFKITPKFHCVESHIEDFLQAFGSLHLFSEETMEKDHHLENKLHDLFSNIRCKEERVKSTFRRRGLLFIPAVRHATEKVKFKRKKKSNSRLKRSKRVRIDTIVRNHS